MPKLVLNQYSFNRGALDPTLQGRPDLAWYQMGAKDVNNMILRPGGGVVKRPGFRFIDYAHSNDPDKPSRLVKFVFSTEQSYILEFSHKVIRIFMDGALVLYPPGHPREGRPAEIETGYAAEQLNDLDFWHYGFDYCQTSDVMYIVHRKHPPAQLIRFKDDTYAYDHHNWRLENIVFGGSIATPLGLTLTRRGNDGARYVVTAVAENNDESTVSNATTREQNTAQGSPIDPVPDFDALNILQCRMLWVTSYSQKWPEEWDFFDKRSDWITSYLVKYIGFGHVIFISNNGKAYYETRGPDGVKHKIRIEDHGTWQAIAYNYTDAGYGVVLQTMRDRVRQFVTDHNANTTITRHSALRWNAVTGNAAAKQAAAKGYRVYRSNDDGKTYRLLGTTNGVNAVTFDDKNLAFASNATPPVKNIPFEGAGNYPGVARFFEQRLLLGGTDSKPATFWGSMTGNYHNFGPVRHQSDRLAII